MVSQKQHSSQNIRQVWHAVYLWIYRWHPSTHKGTPGGGVGVCQPERRTYNTSKCSGTVLVIIITYCLNTTNNINCTFGLIQQWCILKNMNKLSYIVIYIDYHMVQLWYGFYLRVDDIISRMSERYYIHDIISTIN